MSFSVKQGEVFALLGPNGAGKTTTIRILNGLLKPRAGKSRVLGLDPLQDGAQIRQCCGVLTETPALYERLTAWQNLEFFGALAGLSPAEIEERSNYYLDLFELAERAQDRIETYSKGMKQRLALARALLHDPQLLFLDEPTSGMDPAAAKQVEQLIYRISKQENRSVVLCTHRLYEAERVCDRVAVMKKGQVIACGSLDELRARFVAQVRVTFCFAEQPEPGVQQTTNNLPGVEGIGITNPLEWDLQVRSQDAIPAVIQHLVAGGVLIRSVIPHQADLEEIYLNLQEIDDEVTA
jgi:ABC-2 type transport system ATP-binding protein